ncbi:MAG TPA: hypothetical protein VHL30_00320, partial [Chlamydiales bacterium]|nr:hypothetical protein [Chlamydiales bacterium]
LLPTAPDDDSHDEEDLPTTRISASAHRAIYGQTPDSPTKMLATNRSTIFALEEGPFLPSAATGDSFLIPTNQGISESEQTAMGALWTNLQGCISDPANPEKGGKYLYSLHATKEHLNQTFPDWRNQLISLRSFAVEDDGSFACYAYCVLYALSQSENADDVRVHYAFIIQHLRSALQTMPQGEVEPVIASARTVILELCHSKFTRVYLYPFLEDFISKALNARQTETDGYQLPTHFSFQTMAETIRAANQRLRNAPWRYMQRLVAKEYKKLQGTIGWGFDPTSDSNTPWVHSIQTTHGKEITVLRHGTPTRDPSLFGAAWREGLNLLRMIPGIGSYVPDDASAQIIPEYEAHLNAHPEKQTLYTDLQEYDESGNHPVHGEIARSRAIRKLEESHPNFHFLALPLDGPFWSNTYLETKDIRTLKHELCQSILLQEKGFGLPQALVNDPGLPQKIGALLNQVHTLYFDQQELPSVEKKKVFMMLFYSELKDYLKAKLEIDFIVSACKDAKDRAPATMLVDMAKNLLKLGLENDPERLRELFFSALGPFIIKNESIISSRLELALQVLDHFAEFNELKKQQIRDTEPASEFRIANQWVPKEEVSPAQMMSPRYFLETINHLKSTGEQRVVFDPTFKEDIHRAYKNGNAWDLAKINRQLEKDFASIDLSIDGEKVSQYDQLPDLLAGDEETLALLHRGVVERMMRDPVNQLNGNPLHLSLSLPARSKPRIAVNRAAREIRIKQELELKNPTQINPASSYPLLVRALLTENQSARISWHFVKPASTPQ